MMRCSLVPWGLALLGGALLFSPSTRAALLVSEVKDDGGFFKPEIIRKANKGIKAIKNQHKKDLVIETYRSIPAERKDDFEKLGKNRFFEEWARERGRALEANGVLILISREPSHLQVEVDSETRKKAFTLANRDRLVQLMLERFRKKEFDEGLLDAVEFVNTTLGSNLRTEKAIKG
jgi:uncharacterized membrane protein YgcG